MKRIRTARALALALFLVPAGRLAAAGEPPAAAPGHAPDEMAGMTTYVVGLIHKGPTWTAAETPEVAALQEQHLANIRRLAEAGKLRVAGPFVDGGDLRGMFVFAVATVEEAKALCDTDPMVKAGRLVVELHPWFAARGLKVDAPAAAPAAGKK